MSDISLRFPHVFGAIIRKLDDKDLATYRLVSKAWKNSIDNNKCLHLRIINKIISNSKTIYGNDKAPKEKEAMVVASAAKAKNWKHFLLKAPIDVLKEIIIDFVQHGFCCCALEPDFSRVKGDWDNKSVI